MKLRLKSEVYIDKQEKIKLESSNNDNNNTDKFDIYL